MAPIQKASSSPAAGPKGPTTGSLQPPTDLTLHSTKAAGLGGHSASRAVKVDYRSRMAAVQEHEVSEGLLSDHAIFVGTVSGDITLTIHAAISHAQGNSEVITVSPAQVAEFRTLLNKPHPKIAENHTASHNAYVVGEPREAKWLAADPNIGNSAQTLLQDFEGLPAPAVLAPALKRPYVNLPNELTPQSAAEEAHLFLLTTDPRSGFAPEGVAAWIAECRHGLRLERSHETKYDFVDSESKHGWHIASARENSARPIAEIQNAASLADTMDAHLLIDGSHLAQLQGALGVAIRELANSDTRTRILVIVGPTRPIPSVR